MSRFGIVMVVFFSILMDLSAHSIITVVQYIVISALGILVGFLGFVFTSWKMGLLGNRKDLLNKPEVDLNPDESILFETGANHFKGIEAVGGKLYLTNNRLLFKSHKFNFQNHELSIPLSDIHSVGRYRTLGLVNNGLSIGTWNNNLEKYVVQNIDTWLEKINQKVALHGNFSMG